MSGATRCMPGTAEDLRRGSRSATAGRLPGGDGPRSLTSPAVNGADRPYLQVNQRDGVPPLELTGERTLPDVPEENYWYRRHLTVYEWIAERCRGLSVADLACGEGYGSDLLAQTSASVIGVDANPEAHEHARLRYARQNLEFRRELVEDFA